MNQTSQDGGQRVECRPARDPAVRALIVAAMFVGFGVYCLIDVARGKYPMPTDWSDINVVANWAFNFFGQFVFTGVGLIFLIWATLFLRRKLTADEQGMTYGGKHVRWDAIRSVDAARLTSKQVLYLRGDGVSLKLRAWRLTNFRELLALIERRVPADRITR